ncbi:MAG: D-alanyl-D-alanine carboxypeptidase [Clostridia bacterium]|nr:D-alanyl-D-alanine carboxypeptidase [Clostridia bacterium]MBQ9848254.1 D-alanyl-D-alanine carboxypeptidase [Clostridia bacterium]
MKKLLCFFLSALLFVFPTTASATERAEIYPFEFAFSDYWYRPANAQYVSDGDAKALLLMEFSTGRILFAENETVHLPIASVTKVISTLLVAEAIDSGRISLSDSVTVSEHAASMGGSQVFLEAGEQMSVDDLLKSLIVASANDATVALGEHICGSEAAFVAAMNSRARELGCENTNFVNTNGLPAENHYSCALDVAVITRELMKHELVFNYTTIWMDTIRNGTFGLANTNKLIRFYKGATGMKTGFTDEAKYCLSGTAQRNGMHLIAVVLGASTSEKRFASAKGMLDYGFANYSVLTPEAPLLEPLAVTRGKQGFVELKAEPITVLTEKGGNAATEARIELAESVQAPVNEGDEVGYISYLQNGGEIARARVFAAGSVEEVSYGSLLKQMLLTIFSLF